MQEKFGKKAKRLLCGLLAFAVLAGYLPNASVFAAEGEDGSPETSAQEPAPDSFTDETSVNEYLNEPNEGEGSPEGIVENVSDGEAAQKADETSNESGEEVKDVEEAEDTEDVILTETGVKDVEEAENTEAAAPTETEDEEPSEDEELTEDEAQPEEEEIPEEVKAFLAAVEELEALEDSDDAEALAAAMQKVMETYNALTDEQKAALAALDEKYAGIMETLEGGVATLAEGDDEPKAGPIQYNEDTATLTITGTGDETITKDDVSAYKLTAKKVIITDVASIEKEAFRSWPELESVELTRVGEVGSRDEDTNPNTFSECPKLLSVTLTDVEYVGREAFRGNRAMTSLTLKNVDEFGTSAFSYCIALTSLDIDGQRDGIKNLGPTMFYGCIGLEEVTLKNLDSIGQQAFYGNDVVTTLDSDLKTVDLENIGTIGQRAFYNCPNLETVKMDDIGTIGQYAFQGCNGMSSVNMNDVRAIANGAFWNCSGLKTVNSLSNVTGSIGGFAFYGCKSLTGLTVDDAAKMGFIGNYDDIMARVKAILEGKFKLDDPNKILDLGNEDYAAWEDHGVGQSNNWNTYDNGTQLAEMVRWQETESSVDAEVAIDAYFTAEKQLDYIFVADLSASMAQLGNPEDDNARFYDMQSKLLDMTSKLLGTEGYDCRVAIVTFGGLHAGNATRASSGFLDNAAAAEKYIYGLAPLNENTDYGLGLQKALELVQANTDRKTVVIFLSDGAPVEGKGAGVASGDLDGTATAELIRAEGVPIYGVLHSPANKPAAEAAMNAVCDKYYTANDTESFGNAMNAAFTAEFPSKTVYIPLSSDFDNVVIGEHDGVAEIVGNTIVWTINGMPFTKHTLNYTMTLTEENAQLTGTHEFAVNDDNVTFGDSGTGAKVNLGVVTLKRTLYTVTYIDGIGGVQSSTVLANKPIPAYNGTLDRAGYTFGGWTRTGGGANGVVDGDITFTAIWNAIPAPAPADPAPAAPAPAAAAPAPAPAAVPVAPAPAAPVAPAAPAAPGGEELPEPEVPQAGPETTPSAETPAEDLGEEETPLAGPDSSAWALINLLLMACTALGGILMLVSRKRGSIRLVSLVPAIGAVVAFLLTENMASPMVLTDRWTLLMAIIALSQLAVCIFVKKKDESDDNGAAARA